MGHMVRSLVLAKQLSNLGYSVQFALDLKSKLGISMVQEEGFGYFLLDSSSTHSSQILKIIKKTFADVFIGDTAEGFDIALIQTLNRLGILTVAIDEKSDYAKKCNLCFYPPHANIKINEYEGQVFHGLDYTLIREECFKNFKKNSIGRTGLEKILVMMGGTDPDKKLLTVLRKVAEEAPTSTRIIAVTPEDHPDYYKISRLAKNISIIKPRRKNISIISQADLAIIKFGSTAYELLVLGIPAIHLCLSKDDFLSSDWFCNQGYAVQTSMKDFTIKNRNLRYLSLNLKIESKKSIACKIDEELTTLGQKEKLYL